MNLPQLAIVATAFLFFGLRGLVVALWCLAILVSTSSVTRKRRSSK